jgi:hypothetical protein
MNTNMKRFDLAILLSLAALWGASYLFIRMGAEQFGAVPLLPSFLTWRRGLR